LVYVFYANLPDRSIGRCLLDFCVIYKGPHLDLRSFSAVVMVEDWTVQMVMVMVGFLTVTVMVMVMAMAIVMVVVVVMAIVVVVVVVGLVTRPGYLGPIGP
jgi:hypothetical protein